MPLLAWSAQSQGWFGDSFDPNGRGADAFYTYDSPQDALRREELRFTVAAAQIALTPDELSWLEVSVPEE